MERKNREFEKKTKNKKNPKTEPQEKITELYQRSPYNTESTEDKAGELLNNVFEEIMSIIVFILLTYINLNRHEVYPTSRWINMEKTMPKAHHSQNTKC